MGLIKIIPPGSQPKLLDEPQLQLVKQSSRGLRGNDFKEFVKRASWRLADAVRKVQLEPGEELVHNIALGAKEYYGHNRNGDGFKEAACRDYHPTFVKYARWYRHHQNKDPKKGYGLVKFSEYNEDMKRVELLIALNATKEAADRNGCLVADEELKLLHEGKDIPTSMACKVAYDTCDSCGNRARKKEEYCLGEDEGGMCKRGGIRNRMCFPHEDGYVNHVNNDHPLFFDMSKVFRGADRISWADGLVKSASGLLLGGAALAEMQGVDMPAYLFEADNPWPTRLEKLASELAKIETDYDSGTPLVYDKALSHSFRADTDWNLPAGAQVKEAMAALAMQKIVLPAREWLQLVHGNEPWAKCAEMIEAGLPGIYGRMLMDGTISEVGSDLPSLHAFVPYELTKWAHERAADYSLDRQHLDTRRVRAELHGFDRPEPRQQQLVKTAGAAETLARGYALYKLAFLQAMSDRDTDYDLTKTLAIRQNYL